ncbi:MAG: HAMP domain-containing protein [Armatimonadetes bacterium]|nr:HAMP domain-containing protein [Armatimonadota bacterium]
MRRWPLVRQMLLWNLVATALTSAAFAGIAYYALDRYLIAATDAEVLSEAAEIQHLIDTAEEIPVLKGTAEDASLTAEQAYIEIISPDAEVIEASSNIGPTPIVPPQWMMEYAFAGQPVYGNLTSPKGGSFRGVLVPCFHQRRLRCLVLSFQSREPIEKTLATFSRGLLTVAPVVLVFAVLLSWGSASRSLAPVKNLTYRLSLLDSNSLAERLPVRGAGDELDELVEAFNRLMDRIAQAFSSLQDFTRYAAHQLRTPLTVLRGETELALSQDLSPEQSRAALERVHEEIERLQRLVDALLLLARLEGKQPEPQVVEVNSALDQAWRRVKVDDCRLERSLPAEPVLVWAREGLVEELIFNLLDNACRYGGRRVRVEVNVVDYWAQIGVVDDGPGMSEEDLRQAQKPFFRGESAQGEEGSGLGLAIATRIAEAFGGSLTLESAPGEGTRAVVYLPLAIETVLEEPGL